MIGNPHRRRGTRIYLPGLSVGLPGRRHKEDGPAISSCQIRQLSTLQRIGKKIALQYQQILRDGLIVGHMRDSRQRKERMLTSRGHQRLAETQTVRDRHVIVGKAVNEHERAIEQRSVPDNAVALVRRRIKSQITLGVVGVVQGPIGRRSARTSRGEHIRSPQHGKGGKETAIRPSDHRNPFQIGFGDLTFQ